MHCQHCQHCGTELTNKRAKNCVVCTKMKDDAHRAKTYAQVVNAMDKAKSESLSGEAFHTRVADLLDTEASKARRAAERRQQEERAREERREQDKREREALKAAGFRWTKNHTYDFDSWEEPSADNYIWQLIAPDGKEISETDALRILSGETTLEQVRAEVVAAQDAKAAAAIEEKVEQQAFQDAKNEAISGMVEVESFAYDGFEVALEREQRGEATIIDRVYRGQIGGVGAAVTYHYFGGHDHDEMTRFWCENPEAVGLSRLQRNNTSQIFADFFGG